MPLLDPRTDILQAIWATGGASDLVDVTYRSTTEAFDKSGVIDAYGRVAYLYGQDRDSRRAIRRVNLAGSDRAGLSSLLGYAGKSSAVGQTPFRVLTSKIDDIDQNWGYGYAAPPTNGDIHSATFPVTFGNYVVELNLAAGGYIASWTVGGVEILNRKDSFGRGVQSQLEWADGPSRQLVLHRPSQAACRFDSEITALGSPFLGAEDWEDLTGGHHIVARAIPLEYSPDGIDGVPGISTDHGGSDSKPVLWRDMRVSTDLWLDYRGIVGLHRLQTVWEMPFETLTGFLDCAAHTALCLADDFDQVLIQEAEQQSGPGLTTDVSAALDAVDYRRFSYSSDSTFEDEVTVPSSPTLIPTGYGGALARNTGTDLTVGIAGRLHDIGTEPDLFLSDVPRGTNLTAITNRSGATGLDGEQTVVIGLDSNLSGRWYDPNQLRRIGKSTTLTRWILTGTLAEVTENLRRIPETY